jgi:hypothetical protein
MQQALSESKSPVLVRSAAGGRERVLLAHKAAWRKGKCDIKMVALIDGTGECR